MKEIINILLKDIKEDLNKGKDILCFQIKLLNTVKISTKVVCNLNAIMLKIQWDIFKLKEVS